MKQKITIALMIILIGVVVVFMAKDLFKPKAQEVNPFAYDIEEFKKADPEQMCYEETKRFLPAINSLKAILIDSDDNIYFGGNQLLVKYNAEFKLLKEIPVGAQVDNMNIDEEGNLYVGLKNHIEVYNQVGDKLKVWSPYNGRSVITSIAVKGEGVYVADAGNKVLLKYSQEGELLQEIGRKDAAAGIKGFFIPSPYFDVVIGRQGEIWAVNSGYHQLEAYNEQGELFSSWKRTSMQWDGFSGCCNPSHIALLSDGSFVTSEKGLVRIKIHEPTGNFKCIVATPNEFNENTRGIDLAVDSKDNIYAVVPDENQVRVYAKKK